MARIRCAARLTSTTSTTSTTGWRESEPTAAAAAAKGPTSVHSQSSATFQGIESIQLKLAPQTKHSLAKLRRISTLVMVKSGQIVVVVVASKAKLGLNRLSLFFYRSPSRYFYTICLVKRLLLDLFTLGCFWSRSCQAVFSDAAFYSSTKAWWSLLGRQAIVKAAVGSQKSNNHLTPAGVKQ